jgi:hypothetical protein
MTKLRNIARALVLAMGLCSAGCAAQSSPNLVTDQVSSAAGSRECLTANASGLVTGTRALCAAAALASISALEGLSTPPAGSPIVSVNSYYAGGTAGGGLFVWNASSTTTPDGCTVFQVSGVATGRYIRQSTTPLPASDCGVQADDTTDDSPAWQRAFNAGLPVLGFNTQAGNPIPRNQPPTVSKVISPVFTGSISGTVLTVSAVTSGTISVGETIFGSGISAPQPTIISGGAGTGGTGNYNLSTAPGSISSETISASLTLNPWISSLDCQSQQFDMTAMTAGPAIMVTNSTGYSGSQNLIRQAQTNVVRPIKDCVFNGPSNMSGVYLFDLGYVMVGIPQAISLNFVHPVASGFQGMFTNGDGVYSVEVDNPFYSWSPSENYPGAYWTITSNNNSGENIRTIGGFMALPTALVDDKGCNYNADFYFTDVSADDMGTILNGDNGGGLGSAGACAQVFFSGHIEAPELRLPIWNLQTNGHFVFEEGQLLFDNQSASTSPCNLIGAPYQGGLYINDGVQVQINNTAEFFCSGSGFSHFGKLRAHGNVMPVLSTISNNAIADFNFTANPLHGGNWTDSGGGVTYTTTTKPAGATGAIQLVGPSDQRANYRIACKPQDLPVVQFWLETSDQVAGSGTFNIYVFYSDGAGNRLSTYANPYTNSAEHASFTFVQASAEGTPAPPGSQFCTLVLDESGSTRSPTAIVGRPWFGVQFAPVVFTVFRRRRPAGKPSLVRRGLRRHALQVRPGRAGVDGPGGGEVEAGVGDCA